MQAIVDINMFIAFKSDFSYVSVLVIHCSLNNAFLHSGTSTI